MIIFLHALIGIRCSESAIKVISENLSPIPGIQKVISKLIVDITMRIEKCEINLDPGIGIRCSEITIMVISEHLTPIPEI